MNRNDSRDGYNNATPTGLQVAHTTMGHTYSLIEAT